MKKKRYCIAYAVIPDYLEDYAITQNLIGGYYEVRKWKKTLEEMTGAKCKIIKVEVMEVLKK